MQRYGMLIKLIGYRKKEEDQAVAMDKHPELENGSVVCRQCKHNVHTAEYEWVCDGQLRKAVVCTVFVLCLHYIPVYGYHNVYACVCVCVCAYVRVYIYR